MRTAFAIEKEEFCFLSFLCVYLLKWDEVERLFQSDGNPGISREDFSKGITLVRDAPGTGWKPSTQSNLMI